MAVHRWVSTDGNFNAATSWSSATAPAGWGASDEILFDDTSVVSVSSGLSQSAIQIARMSVDSGYSGNIGASSTPLILGAGVLSIDGHQDSSIWFEGGTGSAVGTTVFIRSNNLVDALTLTGEWLYLFVTDRGKVLATTGIANIEMVSVIGNRAELDLTVSSTSFLVKQAYFAGGIVTVRPASNRFMVDSLGKFTQASGELTFTTYWRYGIGGGAMNVQSGGVLNWSSNATGSVAQAIDLFTNSLCDFTGINDNGPQINLYLGPDFLAVPDRNNKWEDGIVYDLRRRMP